MRKLIPIARDNLEQIQLASAIYHFATYAAWALLLLTQTDIDHPTESQDVIVLLQNDLCDRLNMITGDVCRPEK